MAECEAYGRRPDVMPSYTDSKRSFLKELDR